MNAKGHRFTTRLALNILKSIDQGSELTSIDASRDIILWSWDIDNFEDMEFVDVEGFVGDARDDPHESSFWDDDDVAAYSAQGRNFSSFNHFIDIKKGAGRIDDYDGYSYERGSASRDQYQDAADATDDKWAGILGNMLNLKVDEGVNYWFNDEYVHSPGQDWYRNCSPAVERYSYPAERGIYATKEAEFKERFPKAIAIGYPGKGIPYSTFMPVDNLGRYWYDQYVETSTPKYLGGVLHAVQDATIPHHAAGYLGNWHGRYESELDENVERFSQADNFQAEILELLHSWFTTRPMPNVLRLPDRSSPPAINWRVDYLVTWLALHAYHEYHTAYNDFRDGYHFDEVSAAKLFKLAVAMSSLVMLKATNRIPMFTEEMSFAIA